MSLHAVLIPEGGTDEPIDVPSQGHAITLQPVHFHDSSHTNSDEEHASVKFLKTDKAVEVNATCGDVWVTRHQAPSSHRVARGLKIYVCIWGCHWVLSLGCHVVGACLHTAHLDHSSFTVTSCTSCALDPSPPTQATP